MLSVFVFFEASDRMAVIHKAVRLFFFDRRRIRIQPCIRECPVSKHLQEIFPHFAVLNDMANIEEYPDLWMNGF
jgi:hypothetical protein